MYVFQETFGAPTKVVELSIVSLGDNIFICSTF